MPRPRYRPDERGGQGERGGERVPERDRGVAEADNPLPGEEAERIELRDRSHEVRVDRVLVVDPPHGLPEPLRQGQDLPVSEEVDAPRAGGLREWGRSAAAPA